MYLVKRTFRKTDAITKFFEDHGFELYQKQTYQITHDHKIVDDNCMRHIQVWLNEEKFKQWSTDPTVQIYISSMSQYNVDNNIVLNEIRANV